LIIFDAWADNVLFRIVQTALGSKSKNALTANRKLQTYNVKLRLEVRRKRGSKGLYNNYSADFIQRNIYRPSQADETNRNPTPVTTVTIPYIKGTSETISRILQPYNIRVAHKPTTTLRHLLTNVKDRDEPNNRQGAVYKIKCSDCLASYIGETGRNLNTRLTEHKRATRNGDANNHIALHHQLTNYNIDWDTAQCLTYSTNYFQ